MKYESCDMNQGILSIKSVWLLAVMALASVLLLSVLVPITSVQADEPQLQEAPRRPEPPGPPPVIDGHGTGYTPSRMDLSHLTGQSTPSRFVSQEPLPGSWDWRTSGKVTPVENQGACGSCYAFAAIANIESKLLIDQAGTYDFSENNAKECNYHETAPIGDGTSCDGGNYPLLASFFSQDGTVLDEYDPYFASDVSCNSSCAYNKTLLDWRLICGDAVPDTDLLKSYIHEYGPVYTTLYASSAYGFHSGYDGSYTFYYTGIQTPNHAVLIIGWDDTLEHDGGTGGWIVKNSWGTDWGGPCGYGTEDGYFTIAYGSASIGMNSSFIYEWQDYDDSGGIIYYDEAGWENAWGQTGGTNTTAWGLCKYTPTSNTYVTRVEFWTTDNTTDIDIYIYDDFDGSILSNLRTSKLNNSFAEAGYHSVALDSPLEITNGDDVIAVVKFTNSSNGYPLAADSEGPSETGCTFISLTGANGSWTDLGDYNDDVGIRLRTSDYPGELLSLASYSDSGHTTACDNFTDYATENIAYMHGTNLVPSHGYRVAYYDGSDAKIATDDVTSGASGNISSQRTFNPETDTAGTWHVIVCEQAYTPSDNYSASWPYTLISDSFIVQDSAIPEFPTVIAAIAALGLCVGTYLWLRRKAVMVPVADTASRHHPQ